MAKEPKIPIKCDCSCHGRGSIMCNVCELFHGYWVDKGVEGKEYFQSYKPMTDPYKKAFEEIESFAKSPDNIVADLKIIEYLRQNFIPKSEVKRVVDILQSRLRYCQEQNGRSSCKNCGLSQEDFDSILKALDI